MSDNNQGWAAPAGWYPDASDASRLRYWSGSAWTEHFAPRPRPAVPPSPASGSQTPRAGDSQGPLLRLADLPFRLTEQSIRRSSELQRRNKEYMRNNPSPLSGIFERTSSAPVPTLAGWYRDPESGGSRFWDGSRWTGDTRPRRRPFAAAADYRAAGVGIIALIGWFLPLSFFAKQLNDGSVSTVGLFLGLFLIGLAGIASGVYLVRGQGPTTQAVVARLEERREAAEAAEKKLAKLRRNAPPPSTDAATAARIGAIANPETSGALQNLQNLLYTHAISDAEYRAAKENLLGTDTYAHVAKLAELHEAGVLSDYEFAAAKAKALGI